MIGGHNAKVNSSTLSNSGQSFKKAGFAVKHTRGSHVIMNKPGVDRPIVIPKYDEVDVDIIRANLRTARISREKYFEL